MSKTKAIKLGRFDCAVIIRCKTMKGPVRHELMVPKGDPLPVSVNDLLACAMLFGKSKKASRVQSVVKKELSSAFKEAKKAGNADKT